MSLVGENVLLGRIVLARDVISERISGGAKFTAVGTGVTLGDSVLAFNMLVKDSLVLGAVWASKATPESDALHLLP